MVVRQRVIRISVSSGYQRRSKIKRVMTRCYTVNIEFLKMTENPYFLRFYRQNNRAPSFVIESLTKKTSRRLKMTANFHFDGLENRPPNGLAVILVNCFYGVRECRWNGIGLRVGVTRNRGNIFGKLWREK